MFFPNFPPIMIKKISFHLRIKIYCNKQISFYENLCLLETRVPGDDCHRGLLSLTWRETIKMENL